MFLHQLEILRAIRDLGPANLVDVGHAASIAVSPLFVARFPEEAESFRKLLRHCVFPPVPMFDEHVGTARQLVPDSEQYPDAGPATDAALVLLYTLELCANPSTEGLIEVLETAYAAVAYNEMLRRHPEQLLSGTGGSAEERDKRRKQVEESDIAKTCEALIAHLVSIAKTGGAREVLAEEARAWANTCLRPVDVRAIRPRPTV